MAINISNSQNRDAVVAVEGLLSKQEIRYVDGKGHPTGNRRILKADSEHELPVLMKKQKKLEKVARMLIDGDPEVDIELTGMFLTDTSKVYVSPNGIVHLVEEYELVYKPDGELRERRLREKTAQNMNSDVPVKWTGKFIKKDEAVRRFVFTNTKQVVHINGLTFDFLYQMAEDLDKKNSLLLLRGGEKADEPIVMNRGGKPYNAFLEGRVKGDSYALLLHLSNMELKRPQGVAPNGR
ncbi:MAG: hypothetical protein ABI878_13300 [Acidobacteriota bacterium]